MDNKVSTTNDPLAFKLLIPMCELPCRPLNARPIPQKNITDTTTLAIDSIDQGGRPAPSSHAVRQKSSVNLLLFYAGIFQIVTYVSDRVQFIDI